MRPAVFLVQNRAVDDRIRIEQIDRHLRRSNIFSVDPLLFHRNLRHLRFSNGDTAVCADTAATVGVIARDPQNRVILGKNRRIFINFRLEGDALPVFAGKILDVQGRGGIFPVKPRNVPLHRGGVPQAQADDTPVTVPAHPAAAQSPLRQGDRVELRGGGKIVPAVGGGVPKEGRPVRDENISLTGGAEPHSAPLGGGIFGNEGVFQIKGAVRRLIALAVNPAPLKGGIV